MIGEEKIRRLAVKNSAKILLIVLDGVGDIPSAGGGTALEEASTPNLDALAGESQLGLTVPVDIGITPGSGPAHVSLFGYDPLKHEIGRGVLEALGVGVELTPEDLAARANFATRDENGVITDRRAGRIPTKENERLCAMINGSMGDIGDVRVKVYPGKEHRFVVVFSGPGLSDSLYDADPQETGKKEKFVESSDPASEKARDTANEFIKRLQEILKDEAPANTCLLRGIAKSPDILKMQELYGLTPCAIATYPMYKGLARLVGMDIAEGVSTVEEEIRELSKRFSEYDFFYMHVKKTDSYGEDGNLESKIKEIEEFDRLLPRILELNPEVLCITSDHSTPAVMKSHSWHPNPILIKGPHMRRQEASGFSENSCLKGVLGSFYAKDVMQLLMSHAGKLSKYGA